MTVKNKSFPSQPNFPINNPYPLETAIKLVITPGKRRLPLFESNSNIDSSSNISPSHLNTQSESCDQFSPTKSHRPLNDTTKGSPLSKLAARKSAGLTDTNISSGMASNNDESSILPKSNKENIFESSSLLNIDTKNLNNEYAYSIDRPKSAFSQRHGRITISSSDSAPDLSMGATLDEFNINNNNNNSVLSQHLVEESQHEMFGQNLQREEEHQQQQQQQHTPQHTPQQVQTIFKKHPSNGADSRLLISKKENILPYEGEIPEPEDMPPVSDPASKPGYSYALLIGMAILRAPRRRLTLSAIYSWISNTFVYYRSSNSGWQNSIRHNLSLNKAFCKQERPKDEPGKGHYWTIVPGFESHFLALEASCLEKEESSQKSYSSSNNKDANSSSLSKLINANNNNSNNNNNSQQGVHHRHKGSSKMNSNANKSKLSQNAQNDILEFTNNNGNSDVNVNNQEYHHLNTNLCGGRISPKITYQPLTSMPTTSPGTSLKMHRSRVLQYLNCQSPVPSLHSPSLSASSMSTNASSMYIDDYHLSNQAGQPSLQQQQQQIASPRQQQTPQQTPQGCVSMHQTISYHQQAHPQQQMQYSSAYAGYYTNFSPNNYHNSPNIDSSLFFVDPYSENDNVVPSPCKPHYWIQNRSASVSEGLNMTPSKNPVLPLNTATAATKISDDDIIARACFGSPDKREFHQLQKRKSMICGASHAVELYEPEGSGNLTDVFGVDVYNVIAREVKRRRFQQEHHGHNISF